MSNYATTGRISQAIDALYHAVDPIRRAIAGSPEAKLRDRIYSAQRTLEGIEKAAKKMIPGGFQPAANAREDDKRAQRQRINEANEMNRIVGLPKIGGGS